MTKLLRFALFSSLLLPACRELPLDHCGDVSGLAGSDIRYLYIPAASSENPPVTPSESPSMSKLINGYGGRVIVSHGNCLGFTDVAVAETYETVPGVIAETGGPGPEVCAPPGSGIGDLPPSYSGGLGGKGVDRMPPGMTSEWKGSATGGGCGTWSTLVCNRVLGDAPKDTAPDKDEWNGAADGINQTPAGGSTTEDRAKYYTGKGYCVQNKKYSGSKADLKELSKRFNDDKCDVKANFYKVVVTETSPNGDPLKTEKTNGHVETVTKVDAAYGKVHTNSWGNDATFSGGSYNHFNHSRDGHGGSMNDPADPNERRWPQSSTEVWMEYVCKCDKFEKDAKDVLKPLKKGAP